MQKVHLILMTMNKLANGFFLNSLMLCQHGTVIYRNDIFTFSFSIVSHEKNISLLNDKAEHEKAMLQSYSISENSRFSGKAREFKTG